MTYQALVGFSGKIASGKSSTARAVMKNIFGDEQYKVISFSDALREEVNEIILSIRKSSTPEESIKAPIFELVKTVEAEKIVKLLWDKVKENDDLDSRSRTKEIRTALQYWGTSVRRRVDNNYWVDRLMDKVRELHFSGWHVCVDDVRFTNEATAILLNEGVLVRINIDSELQSERLNKRDGLKVSKEAIMHDSETALDDFPWFNVVYNAKREENIDEAVTIISDNLSRILEKQKRDYNSNLSLMEQYGF